MAELATILANDAWVEAGAADQCAVDVLEAAEGAGIVGLDRAAVEDAGGGGELGGERLGRPEHG